MQSLLNIDDFVVEDFSITTNPDYTRPEKEESDDIGISFDIKRKGNEPFFMLTLQIDLNKSKKAYTCVPYRIALKMSGFFSFAEGTEEEAMNKMIGLNGLSILYGIARGTVAQFTATCSHGKFVLPSMNFVELLKKKAIASGKTVHKKVDKK